MTFRLVVALLLVCNFHARRTAAQDGDETLGILSLDLGPPKKVSCPPIRVVSNFKVEKYMGRWYELERFESPFQNGDCGTVDYYLGFNGTFNLVNSEYSRGRPKVNQGLVIPADKPEIARFHVTLPGIPEGDGSPKYNVIITDYKNYAVIYTCATVGFTNKFEFAWIMSRSPSLPEKFLLALKDWLRNVGMDSKNFVKTNQSHCPSRHS